MPEERRSLNELTQDFVPRVLYEDLRARYDEILIKIGRMQEQMLFLLEYRLGEEKETPEGGPQDLKEEILDHIRNTLDFEAYKETHRQRPATMGKLLEELREKYEEIDRLRHYIDRLKSKD